MPEQSGTAGAPAGNRLATGVLAVIVAMTIFGVFGHLFNQSMYDGMIPSFIPEWLAHAAAVLAEGGIAALVLYRPTRRFGALAFAALMVVFLPIHVVDAFRDDPVIGSPAVAWIRVAMQFVLIYAGYWLSKVQD